MCMCLARSLSIKGISIQLQKLHIVCHVKFHKHARGLLMETELKFVYKRFEFIISYWLIWLPYKNMGVGLGLSAWLVNVVPTEDKCWWCPYPCYLSAKLVWKHVCTHLYMYFLKLFYVLLVFMMFCVKKRFLFPTGDLSFMRRYFCPFCSGMYKFIGGGQ